MGSNHIMASIITLLEKADLREMELIYRILKNMVSE